MVCIKVDSVSASESKPMWVRLKSRTEAIRPSKLIISVKKLVTKTVSIQLKYINKILELSKLKMKNPY